MGFTSHKGVKAMQGFLKEPNRGREPNSGKKALKPTSTVEKRTLGKIDLKPTSSIKPRKV